MLGKLEEAVLISAICVGEGATGAQVHAMLCDKGRVERSFQAVWTTLGRMTDKGYLVKDATPGETGKVMKRFAVTKEGKRALRESLLTTERLLDGSGIL